MSVKIELDENKVAETVTALKNIQTEYSAKTPIDLVLKGDFSYLEVVQELKEIMGNMVYLLYSVAGLESQVIQKVVDTEKKADESMAEEITG